MLILRLFYTETSKSSMIVELLALSCFARLLRELSTTTALNYVENLGVADEVYAGRAEHDALVAPRFHLYRASIFSKL